jgi:hypothetical protein
MKVLLAVFLAIAHQLFQFVCVQSICSFQALQSMSTGTDTITSTFLLLSLFLIIQIQPSFALNRPNSSSFRSTSQYSHKETDIHRQTNTSSSSTQNELKEQEKYSSLPHTIFSSKGRLYNVEKASLLSSHEYDITSSLVLALKFGGGDTEYNESILVLSSCPKSPYFHSNHKEDPRGGKSYGQ